MKVEILSISKTFAFLRLIVLLIFSQINIFPQKTKGTNSDSPT